VIDLDVVRRAAGIGCTTGEIATLVGIGHRTFFDHLKADEDLKNAVEEGRDQGRITLRRLQWQQAHAGNPTMLIWLGKQLLGQRDRHEVEQTVTQTWQLQHLMAAKAVSDALHNAPDTLPLEIEEIESTVDSEDEAAAPQDLMQQAAE
jgi:hypothetical protein